LRSFQDEQPGLEVSDFQSNDDLITPRFDKQPGLETVQPDLEPVQPGLEAFQPTRTHATPNNTNSSMSGLGTYDQSRQPTGSNAPELYESSMSVQPRPVSTLPQNREGTPHRHSSSLAAVSQSGSSPQIERRGNDTSPSTSPRAGYRGTAAIKPPTEMLGTVDGSTTKDLGIALLVKHQAHEDKVKAKAEAEAAQGKWKWSSFKGTLGGSKRRSRNSGTIKYSDATLTAALEEAATMGSLHLVEFCLSQGGDVNYITAPAKDKYGNDIVRPRNRALIKAVEKNHVAVVQYLATKCDRTTLSLGFLAAVRRSNIDIAKMLISKGADVNYIDITDPEKPCALGLAIHNKDDEARSELLGILYGRKNLKVNVRVNGWAPLVWMIAHKSLHLEAMDLLRAGADVNFLSTDDEGPLYAACEDGYVEWVQRLLDRGAEVSVFSNKGDSPLGAASANENLEIMNLLVAQGATTKDINHSFNVAARDGKLEALKLLKENGADFNNGSVIEASKHGQMHCLRYLIHCGADFNDSSLHMAVERGMWEAVELHLELGADMFTCATGTQYKFRTKGLGSKTHSVLHHLLNCPNRNVEYRAVLAKLPSRINQLDPQFLIDAVIYLDDDILKWTLRKFPSQKNNINTKVFDDSNDSKFINLLWWVDKKLGLVGYRKYHREPKYEARLLAVKAVLLSFGAKRLCFEYFGNEAPSGFKESCHRLPFCFEA
jgi:ankyrin repeat protein